MPLSHSPLRAQVGDRLVIRGHHVGEPERDAEILEVLGDGGAPPYVVRWEDGGRVSRFYPSSDASVDHLDEVAPAGAGGPHTQLVTTHAAAMVEYLDGNHVPYEFLEHEPTMSAAAEAEATGRPRSQVAKTVVLHDERGYVLAIVPASERLDLHKVTEALGSDRPLRLASEEEMAEDFPGFEVGATPPLGPMLPRAELVDPRLLDNDRIVCAGGDHRHSLFLDPRDVVRLADGQVVDICLEPAPRSGAAA